MHGHSYGSGRGESGEPEKRGKNPFYFRVLIDQYAESVAILEPADDFPGAFGPVHVFDVLAAPYGPDEFVETRIERLPADGQAFKTVPRKKWRSISKQPTCAVMTI